MSLKCDCDGEILVWKKDTWGNHGQHANLYVFVIDLNTLEQKPIFQVVNVRHENDDSRKNVHRYTYAKKDDIVKLNNIILKVVSDYASSSKRSVTVKYYDTNLNELKCESGLRDNAGFFDKVYLSDGKTLRVSKNEVRWI